MDTTQSSSQAENAVRSHRLTGGQLLQRYRRRAGLTQEELAERGGYSTNYIGKLERDQRLLPPTVIRRLAVVLGLKQAEVAELQALRDRPGGAGHSDERSPLAGREGEAAVLQRSLTSNGPPVLLFSGEPGIGKTRLLEEALAFAAGQGWRVVHGDCQRRAQDPYAPFTDALSRSIQEFPVVDSSLALADAGWLGLLLPELAASRDEPAGAQDAATKPAPEQARRLLFAGVSRYLRSIAGPAGTLLVLDDLHWAGADALDLLATLVTSRETPLIRVIGAYRDTEPSSDALTGLVADLARASLVQVLPLGPLSDADARQLLARLIPADDEVERTVLPAIARRAGGVPFFLVSYAEELRLQAGDDPHVELPWKVSMVIRHRVLARPESVQELLRVAAVIGRVITLPLLCRVTGLGEEEALTGLEAAAAVRLLDEDEEGAFRFHHDLIRETIEGDLSAARRRLLHRRIGEALEREEHPAVDSLAFHFDRSDDGEKAAHYLERAGDAARAAYAQGAAIEHYGALTARLESSGRPADLARALEKLGDSLRAAVRLDPAIAALERAMALYRAEKDREGETRTRALLSMSLFQAGKSAEGIVLIKRHLDALHRNEGQTPSHREQGSLWRSLAALYWAAQRAQEALEAAERAAALARATGDTWELLESEMARGIALVYLGRPTEGLSILEEAATMAEGAGNPSTFYTALCFAARAHLGLGAFARACEDGERALRAAERHHDQGMAAALLGVLGLGAFYGGDWTGARRRLEDAVGIARGMGPSPYGALQFVHFAGLCLAEGDPDEASRLLDEAAVMAEHVQWPVLSDFLELRRAEVALALGRPDIAMVCLEPRRRATEPEVGLAPRLSAPALLALAYLEMGEAHRAQEPADREVRDARSTEQRIEEVEALRIRGMALAALGDVDQAARGFREAQALARSMGYVYGEARTLLEWGRLSSQQGACDTARQRLGEAADHFRRLGARGDLARTESLLWGVGE